MWRHVVCKKFTDVSEERFSELTCKPTKQYASSFQLTFDPEYEGRTLLPSVVRLGPDYTVSHSRKQYRLRSHHENLKPHYVLRVTDSVIKYIINK
jgi:hypothetical protein